MFVIDRSAGEIVKLPPRKKQNRNACGNNAISATRVRRKQPTYKYDARVFREYF